MNTVASGLSARSLSSVASALRSAQDVDGEPVDFRFNQAPNERFFEALCVAYADTGNVAWADDLSRLMADQRPEQGAHRLARLLANDEVFHFQWRGARWIPMAQFHLDDMSINRQVQRVRRELGSHLDGWETASWFVRDNEFLEGRRPLDLVASELPLVLQAARGDRFIELG